MTSKKRQENVHASSCLFSFCSLLAQRGGFRPGRLQMDEYAPQQRQAFAQLFFQADRQLMGFFHTQFMPDTAVEGYAQT